jgi:hypothetical protein
MIPPIGPEVKPLVFGVFTLLAATRGTATLSPGGERVIFPELQLNIFLLVKEHRDRFFPGFENASTWSCHIASPAT